MSTETIARRPSPTFATQRAELPKRGWVVPAVILAFALSYGLYLLNGPLPSGASSATDTPAAHEEWHGNVRAL